MLRACLYLSPNTQGIGVGWVTPFGNITTNHLALTCGLCGHTSLVSVLSLIGKLGKDVRVDEVIPKVRCGHVRPRVCAAETSLREQGNLCHRIC